MAACQFCGVRLQDKPSGYCGLVCQVMAGCAGTHDPEGCWEWCRAKRENGYGVMRILVGDRYSMRAPSRVMYAAHYGEVPYTRSVLQQCGTKNCCNPKHLRLGVQELHLDGDPRDYGRAFEPNSEQAASADMFEFDEVA